MMLNSFKSTPDSREKRGRPLFKSAFSMSGAGAKNRSAAMLSLLIQNGIKDLHPKMGGSNFIKIREGQGKGKIHLGQVLLMALTSDPRYLLGILHKGEDGLYIFWVHDRELLTNPCCLIVYCK